MRLGSGSGETALPNGGVYDRRPPMTTPPRTTTDRAPAAGGSSRAPLWAVLAVTFLGSMGTGAVANGVFFLAESAYAFGDIQNNLLGVWMGATYIGGALAIGPVLRAALKRLALLSTRGALGLLLVVVGLVCQLPPLIAWLGLGSSEWTLWVMVGVFGPATGAFWPICESYLSGARRGHALRTTVGRFNITWAGAVSLSYWLMAPLVEPQPLLVLALLGVVHILAVALMLRFPTEPGRHDADAWDHEPHPDSYRRLLGVFRVLLPVSYVLLAAINPFLVRAMNVLEIDPTWKTPLASMWMLPRVVLFFAFERWHGWHGRWWMPIVSGVLLIVGTGAAVIAPAMGYTLGRAPAMGVLIGGLVAFGTGMSMAYVGALYYVLEVGQAEVDAGGSHEALIGVGYTLGPACGLLAVWGSAQGWGGFEMLLLGSLGAASLAIAVLVTLASRRKSAPEHPTHHVG